ncbi:MAG: arginine--tRNA ligase, partial [Pseudomonadota bacterium]|nr:arginine--tRNA ligase [Pseudomonadota bacterium]
FGDDVDRAIQKSDGAWTYFASDVAYHINKIERGYLKMIDVWGADHGGYVRRMQAAVNAASNYEASLDVKICQIVHLLKNGKPFRMSKRAGTFITLEDVLKAVGKDVVRFMMLTRRNDQVLEFDFDMVVAQSRDNPVFYVQYAHARCCSVMRHASKMFGNTRLASDLLSCTHVEKLRDEAEMDVIKELASWPRIVEGAAQAHEPHRIAFYLTDLAGAFHSLWNKGKEHSELRFIVEDDEELTFARLALIQAIILVLASGLELIGIEPIQEMKS